MFGWCPGESACARQVHPTAGEQNRTPGDAAWPRQLSQGLIQTDPAWLPGSSCLGEAFVQTSPKWQSIKPLRSGIQISADRRVLLYILLQFFRPAYLFLVFLSRWRVLPCRDYLSYFEFSLVPLLLAHKFLTEVRRRSLPVFCISFFYLILTRFNISFDP